MKNTSPDNEITEEMLERFNEREEQAFGFVFHKYYASMCFFANKYLQDTEAAEDIVQETFFVLYKERKYRFPHSIALKSFLYSCVQRKALNYLKEVNYRANIRERLKQPDYQENEYFLRQVETEIFEEIFTAVEELPAACRQIFKMSYIDHLDIQKISQQLNIAESTVKTQRQRAKKFLRQRLQHLYPVAVLLFF